jgi:hypothetical protein
MALDQTELAQIVSAVIQALKVGDTGAKAAPAAKPGNSLEAKDRALIAGLKRKGIPVDQIVLMDRNDPMRPFNVKPYKLWMQEARWCRKASTVFAACSTSRKPARSNRLSRPSR